MDKDRQALDNGWIILTAWAEPCSGPGWTNSIIWVLIQKPETGELCLESIQPEEQTPIIQALFNVSFASSDAMTKATIGLINKRLLLSREDNYGLPSTLWDIAIAAQKKILELTQELNRVQEQIKKSEGT